MSRRNHEEYPPSLGNFTALFRDHGQVGTSVTTGQQNVVIWSGVHQKTSTSGGAANHGWPDKGHFDRLKQECATIGIT